MNSVSSRYLYLYKTFYSERSKERCLHLIEYGHQFLSSLNYSSEDCLLDETRLITSVDSYFLDVIKYKEYHFSPPESIGINSFEYDEYVHTRKKINDSKVAAFTAKWLLKRSPIFIIKNYTAAFSEQSNYINELFALNCALYALLRDDFHALDKEEFEKLFYDFRFRSFDDRAYFSRFELIEKNVALKKEKFAKQLEAAEHEKK